MKVYVVTEWAIDYFYKIWGVFTNRKEAEKFVQKLKKLSQTTFPELLDGELHIDEVELDDASVKLEKCFRVDRDGTKVQTWYHMKKKTSLRVFYDVAGNLVVCCTDCNWEEIYEKVKDHWGDKEFLKEVMSND